MKKESDNRSRSPRLRPKTHVEQFRAAQQRLLDTELRGKPPNKQLTDLLYRFSQKSLQGKPFEVSTQLALARKHTITEFLAVLKKKGQPCRNLKFVTCHVMANVVGHWYANGISIATLKSRISHFNWLLLVLGKSEFLQQKTVIDNLTRNPSARIADTTQVQSACAVEQSSILECLNRAAELDRFVGSQLRLIYHLGLAPREVMALKPTRNFSSESRILHVEEGTRNRKTRIVGPLNPEQTHIILEAQHLMENYHEDQTYSPNFTVREARLRFYYFARIAGFVAKPGALTPGQLAKVLRS